MFPSRPDGAVEEKAARSGLFVQFPQPSTGAVEKLLLLAVLGLRVRPPRATSCFSGASGVSAGTDPSGVSPSPPPSPAPPAGARRPRARRASRTSTVTSVKSSTGTTYRPTFLIGSPRSILRRSTRILASPRSRRRGRSASPSRRATRSGRPSRRSGAPSPRASPRAPAPARRSRPPAARAGRCASRSRRPRGRRRLGELPGQQVVAGVPAGDVDDLAAQADLLDVLPEDDLHA